MSETTGKKEMEKAYNPAAAEAKWYAFWLEKGYFTPKIDKTKRPWVCIMPPPNVTGALHQGHALFVGLEDAMTRYHRMLGEPTLWVPGSDHAGISGETVVERNIIQNEGKTKNDLGREEFLKRVWAWMDEYRNTITNQMEKLGASADWTRLAFTMDPQRQRAVRVAFKRLFDAGLIYRASRIVNWDPKSLTVISDLEVEMEQEQGSLWYLRYPVKDAPDQFVTVATTRPETMLGDTGVAVNPNDARYNNLVGKTLVLPLVGREIPVVADEGVDASFGTGAVKMTPGHDPLDFEIGQRHNLPTINIFNPNATVNENGGVYAGLDRFVARKKVLADLEAGGYLVKTEPYLHNVPYSERSGVPVEPLVREQWWVKVGPLAQPALEAAYDGRVKFVPERFKKVYTDWMENIHDWAVSRQLFWGHRIPVWFCDNCGHVQAVEEEKLTACEKCGSTDKIWQDPDVLDTWFSSGMWPFSTLGWPDKTADLDYFYPGSVMETGYEIIFLWVARMIMFGMHFMDGQVPFHTVYLHGIIRDEKGAKMSKSKGNVINPLDNVKEFGSDALRYTLLTSSTPGVDTKLSVTRIGDSRNFANKLWNATRFISLSGLEDLPYQAPALQPDAPLADRWIVSRYYELVANVTKNMELYQFGEAGRALYEFLWGEFCDWYIEVSKLRLNSPDPATKLAVQQTLVGVLEGSLRLLHPFMPFVTEELWQNLPHEGESIMIAPWPTVTGQPDLEAVARFEALQEVVKGIRNAKSEAHVESKRVAAIVAARPELKDLFESEADTIIRLAGVDAAKLEIVADTDLAEAPRQALSFVTGGATVYLPLSGMLDLAVEQTRLSKEIEEARKEIEKGEKTLSNSNFVDRAPAAVVAKEREKLAANREKLARLEGRLADLAV
ncbi:MAG: valine--tRNA ligase [Chloroflexi bacterium]|nr:valine--tRNA ligase [Chloroflexota bacterium]OJV89137.1 MAG: valine--tRNA ligase [Chloroflexi bacterium 54-19]